MKIKISTQVKGKYLDIMSKFNQELLERLTPPGIRIKLLQYDGSQLGNIVHIQLHILGLIKQEWISEITEVEENSHHVFFVDEGKKLPSFLSSWKHKHIVENHNDESVIVDKIEYKTSSIFLDWLMYPILYFQFLYRKPIYKKVFQ